MKIFILISITMAIILLTVVLLQAQPSLPGGPSQAPIDGGLSLVAAAGGAYAFKKMRKKKKREDSL